VDEQRNRYSPPSVVIEGPAGPMVRVLSRSVVRHDLQYELLLAATGASLGFSRKTALADLGRLGHGVQSRGGSAAAPAHDALSGWREIEAWMVEHDSSIKDVAIVVDGYDMGPLAT
jgi:hypothetical protein